MSYTNIFELMLKSNEKEKLKMLFYEKTTLLFLPINLDAKM